MRAIHILNQLRNEDVTALAELRKLLQTTIVLPDEISNLVKPLERQTLKPPATSNIDDKIKLYRKIAQELVKTHISLDVASSLPLESHTIKSTQNLESNPENTEEQIPLKEHVLRSEFRVKPSALKKLSPDTWQILEGSGWSEINPDMNEVTSTLHKKTEDLLSQLYLVKDPRIQSSVLEELAPIPSFSKLLDIKYSSYSNVRPNTIDSSSTLQPLISYKIPQPLIRPLGIGDLKVVKQKLIGYYAGEVAHIENVLKSELKERKFKTFDRSEQTLVTTEELNEETEKDLQTTDRFELKKETEKTIQEDLSLEAGVTVSGSYGPVEMTAHADFAYKTSTKDSQKTSSNYARDVVDRSVTKIQKKSKEVRTTKNIHEIEEINTHGFNNKDGAGHVTGVYRWVDKHYRAQIYNYGIRLMFEFIIPEPAAFYIHAQKRKKEMTETSIRPPPELVGITSKDITEHTYQRYASLYGAQGVSAPPPLHKYLATSFSGGSGKPGESIAKVIKELVVSTGYELTGDPGYSATVVSIGLPKFHLAIGTEVIELLRVERPDAPTIDPRLSLYGIGLPDPGFRNTVLLLRNWVVIVINAQVKVQLFLWLLLVMMYVILLSMS